MSTTSLPLPGEPPVSKTKTKRARAKKAVATASNLAGVIALALYLACRLGIDVALLTRFGVQVPNASASCCMNPDAPVPAPTSVRPVPGSIPL